MPRLREVPRDTVSDPIVAYAYDRRFPGRDPAREPGRGPGNSFGSFETVLAASPECLEHMLVGLGLWQRPEVLRIRAGLGALIKARVAGLMGSRHFAAGADAELRALGVPEPKCRALPLWPVAPEFDRAERAALAYTDAIVQANGRMPDDLFTAVQREFTDRDILAVSYLVGTYMVACRMSRALRLEEDDLPADQAPATPVPPPINVPLR